MNSPIDDMLDREAIRRVLERYCRGIDRLDADLINAVYWNDATDNHGIYNGPAYDFADYILPLLRERYQSTMHMLGQSLIELTGASANAETYFVAYHRHNAPQRAGVDTFAGRYADVLEKRASEWRIASRTVVIEWNRTEFDATSPPFDPSGFVPGRRDTQDVAYGPDRAPA